MAREDRDGDVVSAQRALIEFHHHRLVTDTVDLDLRDAFQALQFWDKHVLDEAGEFS